MNSPGEVRIRNVDPAALSKIEQLADQAGMSRNLYLKQYIESLSILNDLKEIENRYTLLVELMNRTIENNTKVLNQLIQLIESQYDD